jgi:conjugative relaxase-like TrwC/TraI family protein
LDEQEAPTVLRVHVVREGGHHYYVNDLVPGRAEGGLVAGEDPGTWIGSGAAALGLRGNVECRDFAEVLDGRDPVSGFGLRSRHGDRSVAGYDVTLGAPKSVSVLHLLAPREIATEVGIGHRAAVEEAAGYLGRAALGVRRSHRGETALLPSTGAVAGQFLHRTSRTLDPHLHTHLVTANVAQGVDGRWSAVDSRRIFAHLRAAQGIYHARLRLELSERLGATWDVPRSGLGDVVGVDATLRRLFSQRSAGMDEYRMRRGRTAAMSARSDGAYHATRPDKDRSRTVPSLTTEWKQRAGDFGIDLGDLTRVVGTRLESRHESSIDVERMQERLAGLALDHRTLTRRDLVAEVAAASTVGATARTVESVAGRLAEEVGAPAGVEGGGGPAWSGRDTPESRWRAVDVARAVEREGEQLCLGRGREDIDRGPSGRADLSRGQPGGLHSRGALPARDGGRVTRSFPAETTRQLDR